MARSTSKVKAPVVKSQTASPRKDAAPSREPADETRPPGLRDLLVDGLKDLYWAENHLVKVVLPKVQNAASSSDLRRAVTNHLKETKGQVTRLENIFSLLDKRPQAKKCDAMEGLAMEGE